VLNASTSSEIDIAFATLAIDAFAADLE